MRIPFLFSAIVGLSASTAFAEIDATNPARLLGLLVQEGYAFELATDGVGDPMLKGKIEGTSVDVFFYDCTDNTDCRTLQFQVGFDLADGMTYEAVNKWNADMRYGAAYLDEEMDPYLQMDLNIDYGVTEKNFADNVKVWSSVLSQFKDYIDW